MRRWLDEHGLQLDSEGGVHHPRHAARVLLDGPVQSAIVMVQLPIHPSRRPDGQRVPQPASAVATAGHTAHRAHGTARLHGCILRLRDVAFTATSAAEPASPKPTALAGSTLLSTLQSTLAVATLLSTCSVEPPRRPRRKPSLPAVRSECAAAALHSASACTATGTSAAARAAELATRRADGRICERLLAVAAEHLLPVAASAVSATAG